MKTPPALGDDVVHVLRAPSAVLTFEVVPNEDRAARQRSARPIRHLHEVVESNDAGSGELQALGAEHVPIGMEHLGLAFEGEDERPPDRDDTQRLIRGVEDE